MSLNQTLSKQTIEMNGYALLIDYQFEYELKKHILLL